MNSIPSSPPHLSSTLPVSTGRHGLRKPAWWRTLPAAEKKARIGGLFFKGLVQVLRRCRNKHPSTLDLEPACGKQPDRFRIDSMFFGKNPCGQCHFIITLGNRHGGLDNDGTGVGPSINEVDGTAGNLCTVIDRLTLGMQPRERG